MTYLILMLYINLIKIFANIKNCNFKKFKVKYFNKFDYFFEKLEKNYCYLCGY